MQPLPSMFLVFFFISNMSLSGTQHTSHQWGTQRAHGAVICGLAKVPPDCKCDCKDQEEKSIFLTLLQPNLLKTAGRLDVGSKSLKPESVFPPLVPSSMTSLIFAFSAAFLRGFLAGGGVYAASGSDHISGYTSLYGFCSPVGIVKQRSDCTNLSAGICNNWTQGDLCCVRPKWLYCIQHNAFVLPSGGSRACGPVGRKPVMAHSIICLVWISTPSASSLESQEGTGLPALTLATYMWHQHMR